MYVKNVNIKGLVYQYLYIKTVDGKEVCLGYIDRFGNLVCNARKK